MKKNNNNSNNIPKDAIDKENSQFTFQCDNKIKSPVITHIIEAGADVNNKF